MYQTPRYTVQKHGKVVSFICFINYTVCIKNIYIKKNPFFPGMCMHVSREKGVCCSVAYIKLFCPL